MMNRYLVDSSYQVLRESVSLNTLDISKELSKLNLDRFGVVDFDIQETSNGLELTVTQEEAGDEKYYEKLLLAALSKFDLTAKLKTSTGTTRVYVLGDKVSKPNQDPTTFYWDGTRVGKNPKITKLVITGEIDKSLDLMSYIAKKFPNLETVEINYPLSSLPAFLFGHCRLLKSITIPNSVETIGQSCFYDCTSLESIVIPSSVAGIGAYCFNYCTSLQSITIPDTVIILGESLFAYCTSLESIVIPDTVIKIKGYCFQYCDSLKSITIPDSVELIDWGCFMGCASLQSIEIPNSVTTLGWKCFGYCKSLESIEIPSSVKVIGDACFNDCTSLKQIKLPKHLQNIDLYGIDIDTTKTKVIWY